MSVQSIKTVIEIALTGTQAVIMCDAGAHASDYVVVIEDFTDDETGENSKLAPVVFASERFTTRRKCH